jgi:signal transduction histidine kinase
VVFSDAEGNIWFNHYTYQLGRFCPDNGINNAIKIFGVNDGVPFSNISYKGLYQSDDGRIFVGGARGTKNGFFVFHPDSIYENTRVPQVVITDFKVRNSGYNLDSNITEKKRIILGHKEDFFSFEFTSLDFVDPDKNQHAYYLEGLEDDWIYCNNQRQANYTAVPPGDYTFRVKGSNNDGYWNESGASLHLTILPPPWKTWWAYLSYGIIASFIFYVIIRYYLRRQQLLHSLELKQVQTEKLEELDEMKSRFFANISHEFRTPLTLILGPLQGLISRISDKETKSELTLMQRNAIRLQSLINQLLSLSRLESGKMKLQAREENIVTLVRQYIQSFESYAKQKKIDLIFDTEKEEVQLWVDKEKMEKVLYNLLSNAFKYTPEGGRIAVSIMGLKSSVVGRQSSVKSVKSTEDWRLKTEDLAANSMVISISDTGSGIAPDHLAHIFDRFYQAEDSYNKDQEGTGIGLALAKELVELHHGEIRVESEVGKGTTFWIFLPIGEEHLKEEEKRRRGEEEMDISQQSTVSSQQSRQMELENEDMKSSTIHHPSSTIHESAPLLLIVEDNRDLRQYIHGFLAADYEIIEGGDGESGFRMALEAIPDLIISDVMMPVMDGYELCQKIKTDEKTSHIPVILLTARADMESKIEGLETGADDFISKPFDAEELLVRIRNLIEQRRRLKERFMANVEKIGFEELLKLPSTGIQSMDQQFIEKAFAIVQEELSNPDFSVTAFTDKMNMSRMQLHRKLVALTGHPANVFIRSIRLKKAAALLVNKSGNVTEIAYDVGFNNLSYFARCFKVQYGMSPSDFMSKGQD